MVSANWSSPDRAAKLRTLALIYCTRPVRPRASCRNLRIGGNIEFYFVRQLNDAFWTVAILVQRVFQRLRAVHEQAAKNPVLFASDPITSTIPANKDR